MVVYREILRLDNLGYYKKDIASSVRNLFVSWPLDDDVTNASLEDLFNLGRNKDNRERLIPDYSNIQFTGIILGFGIRIIQEKCWK